MEDKDKTKKQLVKELGELRQRISEMEKSKKRRKKAEETLQESEKRYRDLFEKALDGVILHKLIVDKDGNPVDYILEKMNNAAEKSLSWKREDIEGKRATEVYGGDTPFIERYAKVAQTGKAEYFIDYYPRLKRWYEIVSFCPKRGILRTSLEISPSAKKLRRNCAKKGISTTL